MNYICINDYNALKPDLKLCQSQRFLIICSKLLA